MLYLSYVSTVVVTIIYLIPGLQSEARGLTTIREDYNKKYVYPTILFTSFGLFVISYLLYLAAGIKLVMLVSEHDPNVAVGSGVCRGDVQVPFIKYNKHNTSSCTAVHRTAVYEDVICL